MEFFPKKSEFTNQVWIKSSADLITPVAAVLKLQNHSPYAFLLESVEGGATRGRYSIIGMGAKELLIDQALDVLRTKINSRTKSDILPPMSAGYYGYMGYDMVRHFEKLPNKNPDELGIPDSILLLPEVLLIFDSVSDQVYIISNCDSYNEGEKKIVETLQLLKQNLPEAEPISINLPIDFQANFSQAEYKIAVEQAKEYILAGDIFQVVPSRRFTADFPLPPFAFYRALRHLNPSPFLFYFKLDGFHIIGSSPEILVRVQDGKVTIRPIAGTRKRGVDESEDIALEKDLLGDAKEMAEHLMLLDLGRNDVGRVAKGGKVHVTERAIIERYSHVMHIVSNVEGELDDGKDVLDALAAGFPAGTVSGAPKIRAMEIIDEIESVQRKFYGGAAGYFSKDQMDTCITLRTALIKNDKLYLQAGGGVVADSNPEAEFHETENKARALKKAAELAKDFL